MSAPRRMINTMTAATCRTDHLDAVRPFAEYYGYTEIYDSGPCEGKLVVFADAEYAQDYLNGRGVLGTRIEVNVNRNGELHCARLIVDNACIDQVARGQGTAGERLVWTAKLFIENPAKK